MNDDQIGQSLGPLFQGAYDQIHITVTFYPDGPAVKNTMKRIDMQARESSLINEVKMLALAELGFYDEKSESFRLRVDTSVLPDTDSLQGVMRDIIGYATVEALLARVGTIPMRLERALVIARR